MKTTPTKSTPIADAVPQSSAAKMDSIKPTGKDQDLNVDVKIETELQKNELVILGLFVAVLVALTAIVGYLL